MTKTEKKYWLTAFLKTWERNLKDQGSLEAVKCH